MAITDYKITTGEVNSNHVKNAPNILTGTAQTNKNYFDKLPELIVSKHNNLIDAIGTDKQDTLVSGTNIKTVNSTSLLGSGNVSVQPTLVSGTNIKTVNSTSLLGSGNVAVQPTLVSGTNIKTVNSTSLLGSGNISVQPTLVSGTNIKTVNSTSLLGSGDVAVQETLVSGTNIKTVNNTSLLGSGDVAVQPTLVSGTNIKTINNNSLLGSGNISVGDDKATGNARIFYGTCDTAANVSVKEVTCSAYDALTTGDIIVVTFANANTHDHYYLTLKVGSTAQKGIKYFHNGDLYDVPKTYIKGTCMFVYDGTYWVLQSVDNNTTYNVPHWRDAKIDAGETSATAFSDSSGFIAYTAYIIHEGANNEEVAIDFEFDVISHLAIWSIADPIDDDIQIYWIEGGDGE